MPGPRRPDLSTRQETTSSHVLGQPASGLADFGLNHVSFFVDDIDGALRRLVDAGGEALSEVHENSRYEDSPGNGSVYVKAPWGMLIELQTIPNGHYYPDDSESEVWIPPRRAE